MIKFSIKSSKNGETLNKLLNSVGIYKYNVK